MTGDMPEGSAFFPKIILTIFAFFGVLVFIQGVRKSKVYNSENAKKMEEEIFSFLKIKTPMAALLIVLVYVALLKILGFFSATSLFIIAFMYFYQVRSIKKIILTLIGVNVFVYLLFVLQLNVAFPKGLLF
jgi:hypothetical protein